MLMLMSQFSQVRTGRHKHKHKLKPFNQSQVTLTQTFAESITSKMADAMTSVDELLAESVRSYPVLYNKADKFFKDVNKKTLVWKKYSSLSPPRSYRTKLLNSPLPCRRR